METSAGSAITVPQRFGRGLLVLVALAVLSAASHGPVVVLQCTTGFPSPSLYDHFYAPLRFIADETSTGDALATYCCFCYWTFRPDGGYKYYDASP